MMKRNAILHSIFAFVLMLAFALLSETFAQPPGRGPGGRDGRGPGRGEMMQRMDKNGDGVIQPDEVPEFARPFFRRAAERRGLDPSKPIPIDGFRQSEEGRSEGGGRGDRRSENTDDRRDRWGRGGWGRGRGEERPTYKPDNEPAQLRGFGEEPLYPPVPGFDVPLSVTAGGGHTEAELEAKYGRRVTGYVDRDILGRYDKNENSILDPEEWQEVNWGSDPNESDMNNDGRLTRAELILRTAKRWDVKPRQLNTNQSGYPQDAQINDGGGKAAKSNDEREKKSDAKKYREYARSIIEKYDTNKDGVLQRDERRKMRGPAVGADINGDGNITQDEITMHLANQTKPKSSNGKASQTPYSQSSNDAHNRGMIRFRSSHERLPEGLPSWFRSRDRDLDGQISMREFSSSWSASKIAEFEKYDANGDGVITPVEALLADERDM